MHFEKLTIAGFGPYAERQMIDFAALAEKGIFSVTGVTGAGKTTIFDALTYALYGDLPGARETKHIRSDHVAPADPTTVELEFSAGNDRWKVSRSPEYERPKLRATGFTKRPAQARLHRMVEGQWEPHSNRNSEVSARCRELIGLDRGQFERVGLLPQGEFRRLLHAPSRERKALFRTLFGTNQINAAVAQLKELATAKAEQVRIGEAGTSSQIEQARERLRYLEHILWSHSNDQLALLSPAVEETIDDDPASALVQVAAEVELVVVPLLTHDEEQKSHRSSLAVTALQKATDQIEQIQRREELTKALAGLNETRPAAEEAAAIVERAERATPVAAAYRQLTADSRDLHSAEAKLTLAATEADSTFTAAGLTFDADASHEALLSACERQIHSLETVAGKTNEQQQVQKRFDAESGEQNALRARGEQLRRQHTELAAHIVDLSLEEQRTASLAATTSQLRAEDSSLRLLYAAAQRRDAAQAALTSTAARLATLEVAGKEKAGAIEALTARMQHLAQAAEELGLRTTACSEAQARYEAVTARERIGSQLSDALQDLETARTALDSQSAAFAAGAAPRLARQLVPDEPCMVCGSEVHPDPATDRDDLPMVTEEMVRHASSAHESALSAVSGLRARHESVVDSAAGLAIDDAAENVRHADELQKAATTAAKELKLATGQHQSALALEQERSEEALHISTERAQHQSALTAAQEVLAGQEEDGTAHLAGLLHALDTRLAAATEAGEGHSRLELELNEAKTSLAKLTLQLEATGKELATQTGLLTELTTRLAAIDAELAAAGIDNPVELLALTKLAREWATRFVEAANRVVLSGQHAQRSELQFQEALTDAGFPNTEEALAAERPQAETADLASLYATFVENVQQCEADLAALAKLRLPSALPDMELLRGERQTAARAAQKATEYRVQVQSAVENSQAVAKRLASEVQAVVELRTEADRFERIAQLCDAKGASKISLEGYVLRWYLDQVLTQANLRLGSLSAGRYQLLLADSAKDGRGEWGLDLQISDAHTGESREVTSLSGGETFYTSLALALGLSDVLSNNGATAVSSVFIDEGFGSLDEDVIDLTVDVLSQLGNDGVTVGVITHVEAVRQALPSGLTVERLPSGASRVTQHA